MTISADDNLFGGLRLAHQPNIMHFIQLDAENHQNCYPGDRRQTGQSGLMLQLKQLFQLWHQTWLARISQLTQPAKQSNMLYIIGRRTSSKLLPRRLATRLLSFMSFLILLLQARLLTRLTSCVVSAGDNAFCSSCSKIVKPPMLQIISPRKK